MEVSTMDGKKDFGVVTADMLQLDSIWKWTGDDGLIVASASESMLKYNALMHGADKPVIFTVRRPRGLASCLTSPTAIRSAVILVLNVPVTVAASVGFCCMISA
jgi:hypothetical protein